MEICVDTISHLGAVHIKPQPFRRRENLGGKIRIRAMLSHGPGISKCGGADYYVQLEKVS